jgi:hypothetical protein
MEEDNEMASSEDNNATMKVLELHLHDQDCGPPISIMWQEVPQSWSKGKSVGDQTQERDPHEHPERPGFVVRRS